MGSLAVRLSVRIHTYNDAGLLHRAVQSIQIQFFPAHEIIVIDDGSTDETLALVSEFKKGLRAVDHFDDFRSYLVSDAACRGNERVKTCDIQPSRISN
jgi:cellulose synthase/poly-beta-1,6-N-acetylglucosamine synthase-like glycosyltransferase